MTPWAAPTVYDLDCWEDLEDHLRQSHRAVTIVVGRDGPVISMVLSGRSGDLRVTDPRNRLRAQDRRRLHRLGLRPEPGTAELDWTWQATPPELSTGTSVIGARLGAWREVLDGCRRQLVAVLREGLRLEPSQLTLLPVDKEPDEQEPDDDAWDEDWVDVG